MVLPPGVVFVGDGVPEAQAGHVIGVGVPDADMLGVTVGVGVPHESQIGVGDVLGVTLELGVGTGGVGLHVGVPVVLPTPTAEIWSPQAMTGTLIGSDAWLPERTPPELET